MGIYYFKRYYEFARSSKGTLKGNGFQGDCCLLKVTFAFSLQYGQTHGTISPYHSQMWYAFCSPAKGYQIPAKHD